MVIASVPDEKPKEITPLIESSTYRSYKAYQDAGFENYIPRITFGSQYVRERDFLSKVDVKQGQPKRQITKMIRQRIKGEEYLTFTENWTGTDWVGRPIDPVTERIEGVIHLPKITPTIDEKGQRIGKDLNGSILEYEILFSKENVDKWLEETETPRDQLIYTVRGPNGLRCEGTYDQFLYPWNQALDAMMKPGGFATDYLEGLKKNKK